jgi:hypothetical protein
MRPEFVAVAAVVVAARGGFTSTRSATCRASAVGLALALPHHTATDTRCSG